jgi:hypothetical protein
MLLDLVKKNKELKISQKTVQICNTKFETISPIFRELGISAVPLKVSPKP